MKRALLLLVAGTSLALAEQPRIVVDGHEINADVLDINGRIYIPLDQLSNTLGVTVTVQSNAVAHPSAPPVVQLTMPAPHTASAITGKLLYKFNIFESHPDAGAQVWLVKSPDVAGLAKTFGGTAKEPISERTLDADTKLGEFPHAIADKDGEFTFPNVSAGDYLLLLKSVHANGLAERDRKGKYRFKKITVRDGATEKIKFDFGLAAYVK